MSAESGDPVRVVLGFDDGRRIGRTFSAAEAEELASGGKDITRRRDRLWAWVRRNWGKAVVSVLVLLAGSLVIPAATKQWSDRQEALAIKSALLSDLSGAASRTFAEAIGIPVRPHGAALARRRHLREAWLGTDGAIRARIVTYFGRGKQGAWADYQDAMFKYIGLGCCGTGKDRNLETVRGYLRSHPPTKIWKNSNARQDFARPSGGKPWAVLRCAPHDLERNCHTPPNDETFVDTYTWIGKELNDRVFQILRRIRTSDVNGFSDGWGDFVSDVVP